MKTPLHDAVRDYIEKDMSRFHMPGHKGAGTEMRIRDSLWAVDRRWPRLFFDLRHMWWCVGAEPSELFLT